MKALLTGGTNIVLLWQMCCSTILREQKTIGTSLSLDNDLLLQYYSLNVVPPMTIGTEKCKNNDETKNGFGKDP